MALGDYGDNNKRKYNEPKVISMYGTSNTDGVDPSALSYHFSLGKLVITIAPMLPSAKPGDSKIWDHNNEVAIWLTQDKAKLLYDEINYVMANPDKVDNAGVFSGAEGFISFSNGKELGVNSPCLIIRKINQETGEPISVYAYQFKDNYYKTVRNYKPSDPKDFDFVNHPNFEVEAFKEILRTFWSNMSGAAAYSQQYYGRFDTNKMNTKVRLIMDKLGIESPDYSKKESSSNTGRSFFATAGAGRESNSIPTAGGGMRQSTMDELADDME